MNDDLMVGTDVARDDDVSVMALVRFRWDPVGFIRAIYPDAELDEYQLQALEMMARDPNTRILRSRGHGGQYIIELAKDIPKELDDALFKDPGIVSSWSTEHKSTSEIIGDIVAARDTMFATRELRPVEVPDPDEWAASCKSTDTSRQAFKGIANRRRRRK